MRHLLNDLFIIQRHYFFFFQLMKILLYSLLDAAVLNFNHPVLPKVQLVNYSPFNMWSTGSSANNAQYFCGYHPSRCSQYSSLKPRCYSFKFARIKCTTNRQGRLRDWVKGWQPFDSHPISSHPSYTITHRVSIGWITLLMAEKKQPSPFVPWSKCL